MTEMTDKKFMQRIHRDVGRALKQYQLIEENDRIAVAISGGKDSLFLLEALAEKIKRLPFNYTLVPVHVNIRNIEYETDTDYLRKFAENLSLPFYVIESEVDLDRDPSKSKCFVCSWQRRKELFRFCRDKGCSKLALGHHRDDAIETLLMNMIFNGSISSIPPGLSMFGGEVKVIRPLILVADKSIAKYAELKEYPEELKRCPYGDDTRRNAVREIIKSMEALDSRAPNNIFSSMKHIHPEYLLPQD